MNISISDFQYQAEIRHAYGEDTNDNAFIIDRLINIIGGHELRTPLSIIQGFTEIIEQSKETDKEQNIFFESIKQSIKRIGNISNRLGIWHLLRREHHFRKECIVIDRKFVLDILDTILNKENKCLVNISPFEDSFSITGNHTLVTAAMTELIDNAIKFSEQGCEIGIQIFREGGFINCSITNTSYKTSFTEMIDYKPFTQFNRKIYEQQGLGIGLDIASMALHNMGGRLLIQKQGSKLSSNHDIVFTAQFV